MSSVAGKGIVQISKDLFIHSVLHVFNLSCKLLFISTLTKELNCIAKFSTSHCEFQDLDLGRMIDNAENKDYTTLRIQT